MCGSATDAMLVYDFHEGWQHYGDCDQPWIDGVGVDVRGRRAPALYCSHTLGSTDIPERKRSKPDWPGRKRMRTGRRCTTLT
jgi:hypothetical protein